MYKKKQRTDTGGDVPKKGFQNCVARSVPPAKAIGGPKFVGGLMSFFR